MRAFSSRAEVRGTYGMVASTNWLASAAGMAVLERGGNAFDAAVAVGFVLQVVEPNDHGPGGDLVALVRSARQDRVRVVCGQGPAPGAATIDHLRDLGLDMVPRNGLLAPCVPGVVGGWLLVLRELGTWRLRDVLDFALGYASDGYPVTRRIAAAIASMQPTFRAAWPTSGHVWLDGGRVPRVGTRFRSPALAATYRRLLAEAEAAGGDRDAQIEAAARTWYQGFVAEAIDRHLRESVALDITGRRHAGVLRAQDLAAWSATFEQPATCDYLGWRVCKPGTWSQGPAFLQQLALLAGFDLRSAGPASADFVHAVIECAKLAYADREAWYGDPAFAPDLTAELLDPAYTDERRRLVGERASRELRPGAVGGRVPRLPWRGGPAPAERRADGVRVGDTCHLDVVDRWGNIVAATPSGGWFQSSPAVAELGFCLGTRAQMFNLLPGHPNALAPGKRPRTTLSPTLALRDDGSGLAFGTPGADEQDQWAMRFFAAVANSGWDLQQAIDAPMFHTAHFPRSEYPHESEVGSVAVEASLDGATIDELRRRGHEVEVKPDWTLCRVSAAADDRRSGWLRAAASARNVYGQAIGR